MKSMNLLIELRTEELPPKSLKTLSEAFADGVFSALKDEAFTEEQSVYTPYATPRRLALLISHVAEKQSDRVIEKKGPAVASGLDAQGKPSKALEGFMRSAGVTFDQLHKASDGKAEYFVAKIEKKGETLDHYLAGIVTQALKKLPIPKLMRWGDSDVQFVRPVHGLILLHGSRIVPGEVLGLTSGNSTLGHRFMAQGNMILKCADSYAEQLATSHVIASFAERRALIAVELNTKAAELKAHLSAPESLGGLLDEVTALVEWPAIYVGEFEQEYLEVPQECLILTMQQNQKYFPLFDAAGKLLNQFLIVSNMRVKDPKHIISGNARVIRPRLSDARFFYNQDRKNGFISRAMKLSSVIYHHKLGTQGDRSQRLGRIAKYIAETLNADVQTAERAAFCCKIDLLTDMVGEFPELQGIMGRYYALHEGAASAVADAIEQHYRPRFAGDALPQGPISCAVALADKLDSLVGFFGIGQLPTGDKDPFGLRRAALGVLRILLETPLALDLMGLIHATKDVFKEQNIALEDADQALLNFFFERLRGLLKEAGYAQDVIESVLVQRPTRIDLIPLKLAAVRDFLLLPEALSLASANKRIGNILKKSATVLPAVHSELLTERAEQALYARIQAVAPQVQAHVAQEEYAQALKALAAVKTEVDQFFSDVMVNVDDLAVRNNRLALLRSLFEQLNAVADISKLGV